MPESVAPFRDAVVQRLGSYDAESDNGRPQGTNAAGHQLRRLGFNRRQNHQSAAELSWTRVVCMTSLTWSNVGVSHSWTRALVNRSPLMNSLYGLFGMRGKPKNRKQLEHGTSSSEVRNKRALCL